MTLTREQILGSQDLRTGRRGRPGKSAAEQDARWLKVRAAVLALLAREHRWGELATLQRKAQRQHGIVSSEFYLIVKEAKWIQRFLREQETIRKHITPEEWAAWQHRSGVALARLTRLRSRRQK